MTGAELFVRCLENEGVRYVFGVPGEENIALLDALRDSRIEFVTTRHEQGAAFMADVQGRLTGRAGVCLSTLGPGATNLITGVADANMDGAPVVAITGQAATPRLHKESHQVLDLVTLFRPITKYATQVHLPGTIPEVIRKAFKVAQTERFGACHIDLPEDLADMPAEGEPLTVQQPYLPEPAEHRVARAAEVINAARFPIILAGHGVIRARASGALREFVRRTRIPCANTFMAKGVLPYTDDLALMAVGLQARDLVNCGFDRADVVICVGYDLVEYSPAQWNPDRDKRIVHIATTPAEVDAHYVLAVGVVGDIDLALKELADRVSPRDDLAVVRVLREAILDELRRAAEDDAVPLKPQRVVHEIRCALGPEDVLISDVGAHKLWIARMYGALEPNTCVISNGFASMGIALPGAIAARLVLPQRRVLAVCGDGAFMMNVQELETAVRLGTPFVVLVWRDDRYGLIGWKQMQRYGRESYVTFGNPDFVRLAESFGCFAARVTSAGELRPALEAAFDSGRPAVVECPVDYEENLRLTRSLGDLVCPI